MTGDFVSRSRYEREKAAREVAEKLLEDKSRELYRLNVELQKKSDTLSDIVEERTRDLSQALDAAQAATRAKDVFLANMSHEVRTPVTGILGFAHLLAESDLRPEQRDLLDNLQGSCLTLKHIIDDLLDLKSLEHGVMRFRNEPFDVLAVIESAVAKFQEAAGRNGNRLVHEAASPERRLRMGDKTRFEQIVVNLLTNALKFTRDGTITVQSSVTDADVTVVVSDTGIGMRAEHLERIFEDFTQADDAISQRYGGTGLGLSIVRMILKQMGGHVSVTSEVGQGSRFTVVMPLAVASSAETQAHGERAAAHISLSGRRVLVVEDNRINAKVIRSFVSKFDGETVLAASGGEALGLAATDRFDLMIFDINMPEMGGVELLRRIRQLPGFEANARTPALACTANAMPEQVALYVEAGFSGVIRKPFDAEEFHAGLVSVLGAG
jgi:signal transduction histidine kinase/ActR/RegA family two-component response regulator